MNSNYSNLILHGMSSRKQWVLWKYVDRDGNPSKMPFNPTGKSAKVNDPTTWSSFEECVQNIEQYEGIGFVFTSDDPFVGIDLDGCRAPQSGMIAEWAQQLINLADSYTEVSPTGTGVKIFLRGEWLHGGRKRTLEEPKFSEKTPGIEVYSTGRYFAVTGQRISERVDYAEERQEVLDHIYRTYFADDRPLAATVVSDADAVRGDEAKVIERARKYVAKMPPAISGEGGHNATFRVACVLMLGFGLRTEDAMIIFREYNERCQPPWTEQELLHKLQDAAKQPGQRNKLRHSPSGYRNQSVVFASMSTEIGEPYFQSGDMQSLVYQYINDLETKGEVPKVPTGITGLDHALGGGLNFGDLVVLGGLSSHLKSGFAQQIGHHTTKDSGLPFGFISLEMSTKVLAERTLQFASAVPRNNWAHSTADLRRDAQQHFEASALFRTIATEATPSKVLDAVRQLFAEGVKVVTVDYLQLATAGSRDNPYIALGDLASALKHLAISHGGIVIGLAQLRKDLEKARPLIPRLSHIESGTRLGQTADVCLLGLWPCKVDSRQPEDLYQVFVAKNRNGASNACVKCRIEPARLRIMEGRSRFEVYSHQPIRPGLHGMDAINGGQSIAKAR